ncbi:MAG TPA: DUF2442 domain-containing protein [Azospirillaceae bacterium]|nr:DUF2442 domain-containing protein [Azospirillaceae bacterium]
MAAPRISAVSPLPGYRLVVTWETGAVSTVDVSDIVGGHPLYAGMREDPGLFDRATVGEYGYDVHWSDLMEIPCTVLWQRAQAQAA